MTYPAKTIVQKTSTGLNICISSKKNWLQLILDVALFACWLFVLVILLQNVPASNLPQTEAKAIFPVFLTVWVIVGLLLLIGILWGFFGLEKLKIHNEQVFFEKTIFGVGPKADFNISRIINLRLTIPKQNNIEKLFRPFWGIWSGKITLDTITESHCFGLSLLDSDARSIINILRNQMSQVNKSDNIC